MLHVAGLNAGYGKAIVIRDVSLHIDSHEIVSLIGPNGAGKSTFLQAVTGLIPVKEGRIQFEGEQIEHLPPERRVKRGICLVPEGRQVFGSFSVKDNLLLGTFPYFRSAQKSDIEEGLARVYQLFPVLKQRQNQRAGTLSGGEQQMLAIGRSLMSRPRLLLLDEPSLGLAPLVVKEIFRTVLSLHEMGLPIVVVEQNARAVLKISDRTYVLDHGKLVFAGEPRELLGQETLRKAYLGL